MTKANNLYTIKDISEITGVHAQTLRNWEKENLIEPIRVAGNQRIYTDDHVARVREIISLKEEGLQLKGVRNVLVGKVNKAKGAVKNAVKNAGRSAAPKPMMSAAQTLEQTGGKKRGRPAKKVTTPTESTQGKYSVEELQEMNLKQLTDIAQAEGVKYFRQMFKEELIVAIADPSRRDEMKEQAKARTKDRYGHKVYGERRKRMEEDKVLQYAQTQEETQNPTITEEDEVQGEGLVEANVVEDTNEEMDNQQELIKKILDLGESGKSPEEIAKFLVSNYKG